MGMPTNGSPEQIIANALTNFALARRLTHLAYNRRSFNKAETDAFLLEAARRLEWKDAYEIHDVSTL